MQTEIVPSPASSTAWVPSRTEAKMEEVIMGGRVKKARTLRRVSEKHGGWVNYLL